MNEQNVQSVLLIGSGSIAAGNIAGLTSKLCENFRASVRVVLTSAATKFTSVEFIKYAGGALEVFTDQSTQQMSDFPNHIALPAQSDLTIVYPATADFIGKMANGLGTDLASTIMLYADQNIIVVPSMNVEMWRNKFVQKNVRALQDEGIHMIEPNDGMAPSVDEIVVQVQKYLSQKFKIYQQI